MIAHEYAHAEAAYRQGDSTAYMLGRLTFNPLKHIMYYGMWLNLVLAFFNLIPIPPLDGSHVFYHLLPPGAGMQYRQLQRFGFLPIMLVSFVLPGVIQFFLWPAVKLMRVALTMVIPVALPHGLPS